LGPIPASCAKAEVAKSMDIRVIRSMVLVLYDQNDGMAAPVGASGAAAFARAALTSRSNGARP
jgi:hypothetical protein